MYLSEPLKKNLMKWVKESQRGDNPLLTEWVKLAQNSLEMSTLFVHDQFAWEKRFQDQMSTGGPFRQRQKLVHKYSWAIPCDEALDEIAKYSPIIEIGAGTGYWASLLKAKGARVSAFDINPPIFSENEWHGETRSCFTDVVTGSVENINGDTLFLCWPPYGGRLAYDCLLKSQSRIVIYIGEGRGGCTADDDFYDHLDANFELIKEIDIPQFEGLHDYLTVWRRNVQVAV